MSLISMGFGLGLAMGPLLAGLSAAVFFKLPFLTVGLLSLAGAWVIYRYLPETVEGSIVFFGRNRNQIIPAFVFEFINPSSCFVSLLIVDKTEWMF
jgi:MFS family permease